MTDKEKIYKIAQWMNLKKTMEDGYGFPECLCVWYDNKGFKVFTGDVLPYATDYNWLMTCVDKVANEKEIDLASAIKYLLFENDFNNIKDLFNAVYSYARSCA